MYIQSTSDVILINFGFILKFWERTLEFRYISRQDSELKSWFRRLIFTWCQIYQIINDESCSFLLNH